MTAKHPLSTKAKWGVVLAVAFSHPALLYALYPVLGETTNTLTIAAPVVATWLLGFRIGALFVVVNAFVSGYVFHKLTGSQFNDGMPKAIVSVLVSAVVCFGADRLRHFVEQRRTMLAALQQAQKMEAIGRLAGGVAHDINNTLNAIMGSAFALRHELSALGHSFPDLDNVAIACDRGAQLTRNLLGFARKGCYQEQPISLNAVVKTVQALLSRTAHKNVRFVVKLSEAIPGMVGDQSQVEHAVMNLCLNAIDAMDNGGTLTITTRVVDERQVSLSVSDTGTGMDDDVREHAFEPFFTTKPVGRGTGMGLSMVYGTVQALRGEIKLETVLGKGTDITLSFPRIRPEQSVLMESGIPPIASNLRFLEGCTILLADDEPLVLRAGTRMLQTLGCRVVGVRNGNEALEAFKARKDSITLTIADMIMPDGDGITLLHGLRQIEPNAPVLLASGYATSAGQVEALLRDESHVGFLTKPYDANQLIAAAQKLLPERETPSSRTGTE
jgi:two-component system, cell cycle sensor histidine kinase and response regulator CckA